MIFTSSRNSNLNGALIQIDHHTYLRDKQRVEIAKEWSGKLGVKIRVPLF